MSDPLVIMLLSIGIALVGFLLRLSPQKTKENDIDLPTLTERGILTINEARSIVNLHSGEMVASALPTGLRSQPFDAPREAKPWRSTCEGCGAPLKPHESECSWCLRASGNEASPIEIIDVDGALSDEGARRVRQAWEEQYSNGRKAILWK